MLISTNKILTLPLRQATPAQKHLFHLNLLSVMWHRRPTVTTAEGNAVRGQRVAADRHNAEGNRRLAWPTVARSSPT